MKPCIMAIDLGGTKIAAGIFAPDGKILSQTAVPLARRTGPAVGRLIREQILKLLRFAGKQHLSALAIGVSVPGIVFPDGHVWAPNIPGWENYPLREEIASALRPRKIRVIIESDRACYILGESWQGAARGCKNAVFLAVGTGIGAGILVDGKILHGAHGAAGAIGWMALRTPFLASYKNCGCFEFHASGAGLAALGKKSSAQDVFQAFRAGDPRARRVIRQAIRFWGMAVANLTSLFNPEKIIFGGGVFGPALEFLPLVRTEAEKWAQPVSVKQVTLLRSALGPAAGLFGAAQCARLASTRKQ